MRFCLKTKRLALEFGWQSPRLARTKPLSSLPSAAEMVHAGHPALEGWRLQVRPRIHSEFEANLAFMRPSLKATTKPGWSETLPPEVAGS